MSALKSLRVTIAIIVFTALSLLFLDFTEKIPLSWHWFAHFQIVPAILGKSIGILVLWTVLSLLFGRIFCSALCPLGILQDGVSRIARTLRGKRGKFEFHRALSKTRLSIFAVFVVGLASLSVIVSLLDPYSIFGRMLTSLAKPVVLEGSNLLAGMLPEGTLYYRAVHVDSVMIFVSLAMLALVGVLSFFFGRRYCNTICPVGTLLGLLSRFSWFKVRLKSDCISCGQCEKVCKGECIDAKNKTVDASRCVACFNCLSSCRRGSLVYAPPLKLKKETIPVPVADGSKRQFLQWSVFSLFLPSLIGSSCSASAAAPPPPDPSLPTGTSRVGYTMTEPIIPPGAKNQRHFKHHCTACHLCVSKCPAHILRPSGLELGLSGFMQPVVKFDYGFCNYDCKICTEVCPTRALIMLDTKEEKHRIQMGKVVFLKENCVVHTQDSNCGACAEHCPTGAVKMVPYGDPKQALTIPETNPDLCVGCGACEYICPVRPYRAIYVDGLAVHGEAKPAYDPKEKQQEVKLDDFGF